MVTNAIKSIYGARSTSTLQGVLLMLMVGIMAKVVADAWFFYSSAPIPGGLKASLLSLQSDRVAREKNIDAVFDVYVIHLERHKDRWEKMQRLLKENHLHGKLFPAVDGKQLHKETLLRRGVFTRDFLHQANRGEWGCVWSHVNVWRTFLSDPAKKPFLLVLEDDVDLKKNADVALDWLMRHWVSLDWDVLLLGRVRQMRAFCTKKNIVLKIKYARILITSQIRRYPAGMMRYSRWITVVELMLILCLEQVLKNC